IRTSPGVRKAVRRDRWTFRSLLGEQAAEAPPRLDEHRETPSRAGPRAPYAPARPRDRPATRDTRWERAPSPARHRQARTPLAPAQVGRWPRSVATPR